MLKRRSFLVWDLLPACLGPRQFLWLCFWQWWGCCVFAPISSWLPWVKWGPWLLPALTLSRQMSDKQWQRAMKRLEREAGVLCLVGGWERPLRGSDLSGGT